MHIIFISYIMNLSKRISDLRFQKGLKQIELANLLDLSQSSYSRIENNADKLTIEQLEKIAGALGVGVLELLAGEPQAVATDSGRVKELEARVAELEDRLRDKSKINDSLDYQKKRLIKELEDDLYFLIWEIAEDLGIGTVKSFTNRSASFEYYNLNLNREIKIPEDSEGEIREKLILTDVEQEQISRVLYNKHKVLINILENFGEINFAERFFMNPKRIRKFHITNS